MARARRVASLAESLFWDLTPCEVDAIICEALDEWRAKDRAAAYNAAIICATLCNCHRDPKQKPDPFVPDDFMPRYEQEEDEDLSPQEVAAKARAAMAILNAVNK